VRPTCPARSLAWDNALLLVPRSTGRSSRVGVSCGCQSDKALSPWRQLRVSACKNLRLQMRPGAAQDLLHITWLMLGPVQSLLASRRPAPDHNVLLAAIKYGRAVAWLPVDEYSAWSPRMARSASKGIGPPLLPWDVFHRISRTHNRVLAPCRRTFECLGDTCHDPATVGTLRYSPRTRPSVR
jgi:hypothetical protein